VTPSVPRERTDLAAGLIGELRSELRRPALEFAEAPTPIRGGFDTHIFGFRLHGDDPAWSRPLILRLLAPHHAAGRVLVERAVQNTLADLGYPAPRVLLASVDTASLGGAWLVMERRPGRPLFEARPFGMAAVLVALQARLHDVDPEVLVAALDRETPLGRDALSFERHLDGLRDRVSRAGLSGLEAAVAWLVDHRPRDARLAVCHGDFHPLNILHDGTRVTGVLDWPNTLIAPPAYDVASTLVILRHAPIGLSEAPSALRWLVHIGRHLLVRRYRAGHRRRSLDAPGLHYYEAASCVRGMVRSAEARLRRGGPASPLDASAFGERLGRRFAQITGVHATLPPP
jgi:aminoglycoside phosphotransferase (APT) family kinase protein